MGDEAEAEPAGLSVCLFCGSSPGADPAYLNAASTFGRLLAEEGVRLVYGGGGLGLMGAAARAAHAAGGAVLGVMPHFLQRPEALYEAVPTITVGTLHERKRIMAEEADAFAVLPGGIGTLEEVVEVLSWSRLELHRKPTVFLDVGGYWRPFFQLMRHTVTAELTPPWIDDLWSRVEGVEAVLPEIRRQLAARRPRQAGRSSPP